MDAAALQKMRKDRIAGKQKVESAFGYSPQHEKPVALNPETEHGRAFHFWGPPPDAGFTYGAYTCANCKSNVILSAGVEQHCPHCGSPVGQSEKTISKEIIDQAIATAAFSDLLNVCPTCEKKITTTITPALAKALESVYCPQCGTEMPKAAEALKVIAEGMEDELPPETCTKCGKEPCECDKAKSDPDPDLCAKCGKEPCECEPVAKGDPDPDAPKTCEKCGKEPCECDTTKSDPDPDAPIPGPTGEVAPPSEVPPAAEPKAESSTVETLSDISALAGVKSSDVEMVLFGANTDKPYWDVYVKQQPTARIHLADLPKPQEVRARFLDVKLYPNDIADAIEKFGCQEILASQNAKMFAYKLDEGKMATRIKSKVQAELQQDHVKKLTTLKDKFMKAIVLAAKAADVNFFKGTQNTLKDALYSEMERIGIADPISVASAAFQKGQVPYIESLLNQAVEFLGMDEKALEQVAAAIDKINPTPTVGSRSQQLKDKLVRGNVPVTATSGEKVEGTTLSQDNFKGNLKQRVNLSRRGF